MTAAQAAKSLDYGLEKDSKIKPEFLYSQNVLVNPITGEPTSARDIYLDMLKTAQNSRHKIDKPFWQFIISPPDECKGWTNEQIKDFLQNVVLPELKKQGLDFDNCQLAAALHRDTKHLHIHITACGISLDDRVVNPHQSHNKSKAAANAIADRMGWTRAEDRGNQRKAKFHEMGLQALRQMEEFNLARYFAILGHMNPNISVHTNTPDKQGVIHGYSITEHLYHLDGSKSSDITYKASELGFGDDLTCKNLYKTWCKLHGRELPKEETKRRRWHDEKGNTITLPKRDRRKEEEEARRRAEKEAQKRAAEKAAAEKNKKVTTTTTATQQQKKVYEHEDEARRARINARNCINRVLGTLNKSFTSEELEKTLPAGIISKAINDYGSAVPEENRRNALNSLVESCEDVAGRAAEVTQTIVSGVLGIITAPASVHVPSGGGGGGGQSGKWNDDKDKEFKGWKDSLFGMKPAAPRFKRRR